MQNDRRSGSVSTRGSWLILIGSGLYLLFSFSITVSYADYLIFPGLRLLIVLNFAYLAFYAGVLWLVKRDWTIAERRERWIFSLLFPAFVVFAATSCCLMTAISWGAAGF
jgi:hypothetical protein